MTTFQIHDTVGAIVRDYPSLSRLFEQAKVDYCCGGKKTIAEACTKEGIDPETFLAQLDKAINLEPSQELEVSALSLTELADHIENTHHVYLRSELPRLQQMTAKVAAVHGDKEPRLYELKRVFHALAEELTLHLMKEEQILFPMIRAMEANETLPAFHCGSVANPVARMEFEHDEAGVALSAIRQLTDNFTPPEWACNTYRALLHALAAFEADMHQHIHKENNVLFPAAIVLERDKQA